jgi:hypothetical protein
MSKAVVNLTIPFVLREIEAVLDTYTQDFYRNAFAIPELRQELVAFVLSRIPNRYMLCESGRERLYHPCESSPSLEERLRFEATIYEGIQYVLQTHPDFIEHQLPIEVDDPAAAPSHWFG